MMKTKKNQNSQRPSNRGNHGTRITHTELLLEGRKRVEIPKPTAPIMRAELTRQLFATLHHRDAVVKFPLEGRNRSGSIFNLQTKAKRLGGDLHTAYQPTEKVLYAWLTPNVPTPPPL